MTELAARGDVPTMPIDAMVVGDRFRRDLGDVAALARSIADVGLLHPVVVTPDGKLVVGQRRLEACKRLGWAEVPVRVVDLDDLLQAEHDENAIREDFRPSEAVAIARALEDRERERASARGGSPTSGAAATGPRGKVSRSGKAAASVTASPPASG